MQVRIRIAPIIVLAAGMVLMLCNPASATRLALVVGNSDYAHAGYLPNPTNDAHLIASVLEDAQFDVILGIDLERRDFEQAIRDFSRRLPDIDIALFYFAGHAVQVEEENYLLPVDAELRDITDVDFESVSFNTVLRQMQRTQSLTRTNLVFLDACRDNPFIRRFADNTRGIAVGDGLARSRANVGTLLAFSTQPGNVAVDGLGENSPFTGALAKWLRNPGLEIRQVLTRVRGEVVTETNGQQVPWDDSSLLADVYLFGDTGTAPASPTQIAPSTPGSDAPQRPAQDQAGERQTPATTPTESPRFLPPPP